MSQLHEMGLADEVATLHRVNRVNRVKWGLPAVEELKKDELVRAWRLSMGFTAWPPWRSGVPFTGDSLGAGKPGVGRGHLQGARVGAGGR